MPAITSDPADDAGDAVPKYHTPPCRQRRRSKINQVLHIFLIGIIPGICLSMLPCCIFMIRRNHYRRNRRQICTSDIRPLCRLLRPDATPFRHSRRIVLRFNLLRWRCRNHFNITVCSGRCCTSHQQKTHAVAATFRLCPANRRTYSPKHR